MAQILKLPVQATKLGFKRVRKGRKRADDSNQLHLFATATAAAQTAEILEFTSGLSPFEQALLSDERGDQRAAELYARAIDQQDCVADAFCNLGILESENGNAVKAFDCFTTCLKHNPRHTEAHYNLANLYFDQNDFRLAQLHFELAVEVDPAFANAYFNLALVQAINADAPAAFRTLSKYKQLVSPTDARIAEELLDNLMASMDAAKKKRLGSA
jgi:tetratricopeptide (TPR) repeat protein